MNDKAWNVHRTNPDHLQKLLNDHAAKGYRLHSWLRDGGNLYAIFRNEQTEEMMIQAARIGAPGMAEGTKRGMGEGYV